MVLAPFLAQTAQSTYFCSCRNGTALPLFFDHSAFWQDKIIHWLWILVEYTWSFLKFARLFKSDSCTAVCWSSGILFIHLYGMLCTTVLYIWDSGNRICPWRSGPSYWLKHHKSVGARRSDASWTWEIKQRSQGHGLIMLLTSNPVWSKKDASW